MKIIYKLLYQTNVSFIRQCKTNINGIFKNIRLYNRALQPANLNVFLDQLGVIE